MMQNLQQKHNELEIYNNLLKEAANALINEIQLGGKFHCFKSIGRLQQLMAESPQKSIISHAVRSYDESSNASKRSRQVADASQQSTTDADKNVTKETARMPRDSLKQQLMCVDNELLGLVFNFAANALNRENVIKTTSVEVGLPTCVGHAISKILAEMSLLARKNANQDGTVEHADLKQSLMKVDTESLEHAIHFAAYALNDAKIIRLTSKQVGVHTTEGYAITKFFSELHFNKIAIVTDTQGLVDLASDIRSAMSTL